MALYPAAVKRLIPHNPAQDPPITPRVAILHVDAGGATGADLARYFSVGSGGIESHFSIDYDGTVTQFRDTAYQADANMSANNFAVSIESQGKADGTWTAQQLASIKALLSWLHTTHGIPLTKCPRWDGSGVGYHILFMQEWAGGPRSCPGPLRIGQFNDVLIPWMADAQQPASSIPTVPKAPKPTPKPAPTPTPSKGLNVRLIDLRDVTPYVTGPGVKPLQRLLGVPADGLAGPGTRAALIAAQKRCKLTADAVFGPATAEALLAGK